jgi:hypothetical protein
VTVTAVTIVGRIQSVATMGEAAAQAVDRKRQSNHILNA